MKTIMEITMIVMGTITMLNNNSLVTILSPIVIGIFSSLIASFIFWYLSIGRKTPKIDITAGINKKDKNGVPEYRMKVLNQSDQLVFDVIVYIQLIYKGKIFHIRTATIPFLHPKNKSNFYWERHIRLDLLEIRKDMIDRLKKSDPVRIAYYNKKLFFDTFYKNDSTMRFQVIIKAHSPDGVVLDKLVFDYGNKELENAIKKRPFLEGSTDFMPDKVESI